MKRTWLILLLIMALQLLLRLPFIAEPLSQDEGIYSCVAARLAHGDVLYRDLIDNKPPGIFYLYRSVYQLFGWSAPALRWFTAFFGLLSTLAVFLLGRRCRDERAGLLAALFFAVFSGGVFVEGAGSNTEVYMVLPLLLALLAFFSGALFWAGLLSGLALLFKPVAVFPLLVLLGFACWSGGKPGWRRPALFLAGSAGLPLLTLLYFWSQGAGEGFINCNLFYSLGMVNPRLGYFLFKTVYLMLFENSVLWLLAALGLCLAFKERLLLAAWTLAALAGAFAAGYSFGHYYLPLIPGLSLLAGIAVAGWPELKIARRGRAAFGVLLAALTLLIVASQYEFYTVYSPAEIARQRYGTPANELARRLGARLGEITLPRDRILTKSLFSAVFYAGRLPAGGNYLTVRGGIGEISLFGRQLFAGALLFQRDPAMVRAIDEDFYRALADDRTKYYVVYLPDYYAPPDAAARLQEYGYRLDRSLTDAANGVIVYRREVGKIGVAGRRERRKNGVSEET